MQSFKAVAFLIMKWEAIQKTYTEFWDTRYIDLLMTHSYEIAILILILILILIHTLKSGFISPELDHFNQSDIC